MQTLFETMKNRNEIPAQKGTARCLDHKLIKQLPHNLLYCVFDSSKWTDFFTQVFRQCIEVLTCRVNCATLLVQAICTIFLGNSAEKCVIWRHRNNHAVCYQTIVN